MSRVMDLLSKRGTVDILREFHWLTYYQNYDRGRGVLMELQLIAYATDKNKTIVLTPGQSQRSQQGVTLRGFPGGRSAAAG